eukprot:scaffold225500_cov23-Tisochrysis_lutea.AAC.2
MHVPTHTPQCMHPSTRLNACTHLHASHTPTLSWTRVLITGTHGVVDQQDSQHPGSSLGGKGAATGCNIHDGIHRFKKGTLGE